MIKERATICFLLRNDGEKAVVKSRTLQLAIARRCVDGVLKVRSRARARAPKDPNETSPAPKIVIVAESPLKAGERFASIMCISLAFAIRRYRNFSVVVIVVSRRRENRVSRISIANVFFLYVANRALRRSSRFLPIVRARATLLLRSDVRRKSDSALEIASRQTMRAASLETDISIAVSRRDCQYRIT